MAISTAWVIPQKSPMYNPNQQGCTGYRVSIWYDTYTYIPIIYFEEEEKKNALVEYNIEFFFKTAICKNMSPKSLSLMQQFITHEERANTN